MDIRDKAAVNLDYTLTIADVIVWSTILRLFGAAGRQDKWENPMRFPVGIGDAFSIRVTLSTVAGEAAA